MSGQKSHIIRFGDIQNPKAWADGQRATLVATSSTPITTREELQAALRLLKAAKTLNS